MKVKSDIGVGIKPPKEKCDDLKCPWHGKIPVRGRIVEGIVKSAKPQKTVIITWDYNLFRPKYERFERRKGSLSAYNPPCINAKEGEKVVAAECRPLSKTKKLVVVGKG